ncbi:hypothetical protein M422DRAFT_273976 [Sphaerobolus stellatus SS14]|uniref:Uncharacterized protein n=1 Tax=Sphaerobolus stellatus (strain SS14) TaxID=990650 RepID=A0A0C9T7T6_SPHS4|nr:hypothetical protein M422DRAFT_273976 [Sphaerobolus stellatus SS14]
MSSNIKLTNPGISTRSLIHMDSKDTQHLTSNDSNQGYISPYLIGQSKSDSINIEDISSEESEDMEDELDEDDDKGTLKKQEDSDEEISDLDTDTDIDDLPCPWHVTGDPEYKKQYKHDWFALPIDCKSFPNIVFPKAPTIGTRVMNAFRWTKDRGMFTDFVKVKHIDSPWNNIAHYVDWEAYGYDLKLIGTISLNSGSHQDRFSVYWKSSHTWYDAVFEDNAESDPQEVFVMRHNLALPSLYAWMEPYHKQILTTWMMQNKEKFWYI